MIDLKQISGHTEKECATLLKTLGVVVLPLKMDSGLLIEIKKNRHKIINNTVKNHFPSNAGFTNYKTPQSGNRGRFRYSVKNLFEYDFVWDLVANRYVLNVLKRYWNSDKFSLADTGGDFCMPKCEEQNLHSDQRSPVQGDTSNNWRSYSEGSFLIVNFLIDAFSKNNGPIRIIPGTHTSNLDIPKINDEPKAFMENVLIAPEGTVLIRDARTWHGGTINKSRSARVMLGVGYFSPWYKGNFHGAGKIPQRTISKSTYLKRSSKVKRLIEAHVDFMT